jgi:hypothetical protein
MLESPLPHLLAITLFHYLVQPVGALIRPGLARAHKALSTPRIKTRAKFLSSREEESVRAKALRLTVVNLGQAVVGTLFLLAWLGWDFAGERTYAGIFYAAGCSMFCWLVVSSRRRHVLEEMLRASASRYA